MGPSNGLPIAVPHRIKRLRVVCGRGPSVCFRPCTVKRDAPLFGFKCNLDCAGCVCSRLTLSSARVPESNGIRMSIGITGANAVSNRRVVRLCVHSLCSDTAHPMGRLGSFEHMTLHTNRAGAISFALPTRGFTFCSGGVGCAIRSKSCRVVMKTSSESRSLVGGVMGIGW